MRWVLWVLSTTLILWDLSGYSGPCDLTLQSLLFLSHFSARQTGFVLHCYYLPPTLDGLILLQGDWRTENPHAGRQKRIAMRLNRRVHRFVKHIHNMVRLITSPRASKIRKWWDTVFLVLCEHKHYNGELLQTIPCTAPHTPIGPCVSVRCWGRLHV